MNIDNDHQKKNSTNEVNGERNPDEVYKDFRTAIVQILGSVEEPNLNGISGVGADGIPGEIVGIEPAPVRNREKGVKSRGEVRSPGLDVRSRGHDVREAEVVEDPLPAAVPVAMPNGNVARIMSPKPEVIKVRGTTTRLPTLWVVGGPGSNKATLCQRAVLQRQGWIHFSLGQRLRALAEAGGGPASEGAMARAAVSGGEPAAGELVERLVRAAAGEAARLHCGLLLDGFPRDLEQMHMFQDEFHVTPRMVLLDCSKLQLGRGRRDDSVAAFRRRLEVFREHSLPMLKTLDQQHRLVIVDGDTDSPEVQAEFTRVLLEEMEKAEAIAEMPEKETKATNISAQPHTQLTHNIEESTLQRTAALPRQQNGSLPNGVVHNGFFPNNKVKPIANVTKISTISQMTHDDVKRLYQQSTGEVSLNTHHI
ncbi:unnamed protein product [Parnassius apollo]|uniref:(apollo) hypothetical protein n=1 Tax=Parnassius apollo TaxID=110799 RepID=A0A8S3XYX1_PARAO|nr:unnamed protein product [Parnassius apollo]